MLKKINRRKIVRKNFPVDVIFKGILIDKIPYHEKLLLKSSKCVRTFFDDDLFIHILLQKNKMFYNKLTDYRTERLFPFYPSFVPLPDAREQTTVVSKHEYYWTATTIIYPCIVCDKDTISFIDDYTIKNVVCGKCLKEHYIKNGKYEVSNHDSIYSKFHLDFFRAVKKHHLKVFDKLLKREKSYYSNDKSISSSVKAGNTLKLNKISKLVNSLIE